MKLSELKQWIKKNLLSENNKLIFTKLKKTYLIKHYTLEYDDIINYTKFIKGQCK